MRLRNIPRAREVLDAHEIVMKNEKEWKGRWSEAFGNANPVHIEIGMGKGQFIITLAKQNPNINYIGIERYSSVLLRAVEKLDEDMAESGKIENLRFICMDATEIEETFAPEEVARIYLNFSDPWPKKRHARRRLTSREFFSRYHKALAHTGTIEFKTDNRDLFAFSLEEVVESGWQLKEFTWDLHHDERMNQGNVMTEYEAKFSSMGNPIHKLIAYRTI